MQHFPAAGEVIIFDRSWYNRAGVEYVMEFCSKEQYQAFVAICPKFESHIVESGIILIKFWLEVGQDEQRRRFERADRRSLRPVEAQCNGCRVLSAMVFIFTSTRLDVRDDPHKRRALVHRPIGRQAAYARLNCISHILNLIPHKKVRREKIKLPKRSQKHEYDDQATLKDRTFCSRRFSNSQLRNQNVHN